MNWNTKLKFNCKIITFNRFLFLKGFYEILSFKKHFYFRTFFRAFFQTRFFNYNSYIITESLPIFCMTSFDAIFSKNSFFQLPTLSGILLFKCYQGILFSNIQHFILQVPYFQNFIFHFLRRRFSIILYFSGKFTFIPLYSTNF